MSESEMNASAVAIALGVTCLATATVVGLGLRALRKRYEDAPLWTPSNSKKTILDLYEETANLK